ncbi:MAG TPA: ABC transporter permease [Terriglobales bacterium]|jgi:putative ABC transport system permease protein|nr:ABC transporter permease [Terriglobales bacterium]
MHTWIQDLRYGARILRKTPAFTVVAILTLAIGIGANTAIFSIVDAVLFRPLAMAQPERVMLLQEIWQGRGGGGVSVGNFADIRQQNSSFSSVSSSASAAYNLATEEAPERIDGESVDAEYFNTFQVSPLLGRVFTSAEDAPGRDAVAVISERLWRTRFHEDRGLMGRAIHVNGVPLVVVGVMPRSFDPLLSKSDIWIPAAYTAAQLADHDNHYLEIFARLKDGVSVEQARAELNVLSARQAQRYPIDDKDRGFSLTPLTEVLLGDQRVTLFTVVGAVGFVLLIGCANIANLQLARARGRQGEIAVRAALGATPKRIVRQLLAENLLLAGVSAIVGIFLAIAGVRWLIASAPPGVPRIEEARVDTVALCFAAAIAVVSSLLFGMAPALRSASVRLTGTFQAARSTSSRDHVRSLLVVGEVALALMLLAVAGLLVRSAMVLAKVQPGFDTSNLMAGRVGLPEAAYSDPAKARQGFEGVLNNIEGLPGVASAAVVSRAPLMGGGSSNGLLAEGKALDSSNLVDARVRIVSPGYLTTTRIPLRLGRDFTPADTRDRTLVVLVNETLARTMWPNQNPIGKRFACCESGPRGRMDPVWHEVAGVVGDVRAWGLDRQIFPEFYMPIAQMPPSAWDWIGRTMDIVVRTQGAVIPVNELRAAVAKAAPGVPIYRVSTLQERVSSQLEQSHFDTFLLTTFAATALLLAAVGIYGVLSYTVVQRTKDIGVRMALGASQSAIVRDVLGHGLLLTGVGVVIGLVGALAGARLIRSLLYGVQPTDLGTFVVVSVVMTAVALIASYIPAHRASHVDPMVALRYE